MDKEGTLRLLLAVVLSMGLMLSWNYFFGPEPRPPGSISPPPLADGGLDSSDPSSVESEMQSLAAAPLVEAPVEVSADAISGLSGEAPRVLRSPTSEVTLSSRGGRILEWRLLDYEKNPGSGERQFVDLVSPAERKLDRQPLYIETADPELTEQINSAWYRVTEAEVGADQAARVHVAEGSEKLIFEWADGQGLEVRKEFILSRDERFLAAVEWDVKVQGRSLSDARITWGPGIGRPREAGSNFFMYRGDVVTARGDDTETLKSGKIDRQQEWPASIAPDWIGITDQYFSVVLVPARRAVTLVRPWSQEGIDASAGGDLSIETSARSVSIFAGPKSVELLEEVSQGLGHNLNGLIPWGWFGVIARPLYSFLAWFYSLVGNWGVAIILLTLVVRLAMFPITQGGMVKMRKAQQDMARLQPKIKKIKEKYKDKKDMEARRKMQEETMELYRREGVNPAAMLIGCLPLLLQMPIFFGIYKVLSVSAELRGAPFVGWIHDLSIADPYWITPILMGATMLLQQLMTATKTEDPQQKSQQRMMLMMPFIFTYMFLNMPSGLVLYWLSSNVFGILQQLLINRQAAGSTTPAAGKAKAGA